jgi:hypothetical protein
MYTQKRILFTGRKVKIIECFNHLSWFIEEKRLPEQPY